MSRYNFVHLDLGHEISDEHGWRNYTVDTFGDTAAELLANMSIGAFDQDGGELYCLDFLEADPELKLKACQVVQRECEKVTA